MTSGGGGGQTLLNMLSPERKIKVVDHLFDMLRRPLQLWFTNKG